MGTVTQTVTLNPSGNTGITNFTTSTSYPVSRGYNDTTNTSYARFSVTKNATGYIYYTIDCSSIPADATITEVTAKARAYVNSTSRVTASTLQLCAGTTAKGTSVGFQYTTGTVVTLSCGTGWTRANLNDLRLKVGGTGYNGSSSRYVYFAGAEITIKYTVTTYDITTSGDGVVDPASATVAAGGSSTLAISFVYNPTVKDNGVDVTSQLVATSAGYTYSLSNIQADHAIVVTGSSGGPMPVITVGTPSRSVISDETGYDESTCTFTCDLDLLQWEARATKDGTSPGRGVGVLVDSGVMLAKGSSGSVTVDDSELINGDGEYKITVWGQSAGGVWSNLVVKFIPSGSTGLTTADSKTLKCVEGA